MATATIGATTPAGFRGLIDSGADDATRRSISRQVKSVIICTFLMAFVFLGATANAVITIDAASTAADRGRAEAGVRLALAEGQGPSNTLVRTIARNFELQRARLTEPGLVAIDETAIPLGGGYVMAFVPRTLGTETFRAIAPIRISIAFVLILCIGLILHRLHALARHMDAQRIAARHLATLDPLTGLSNRLHFNDCLAREIDAAAVGQGRAALLLLDLDGFKTVNDRHGHVAGDRLLQEVAQRLRAHAAPDDIVARLGGDEFAIIRRHDTHRHDLADFAAGLRGLISAPCQIDGRGLTVSISCGIARIEHETLEAEALIRAADVALCRAKADAGGCEFAGHAARRVVPVLEAAA